MTAATNAGRSRALPHPTATPGTWAVYDGWRLYLDMGFGSADGAHALREDLLRHHPPGHVWRMRLRVRRVVA